MKNRGLSTTVCLILCFCLLTARLAKLQFGAKQVNQSGAKRSVTLSQTYGNIYGRNLKRLTNTKEKTLVCAVPQPKLMLALERSKSYTQFTEALEKGEFYYGELADTSFFDNFEGAQRVKVYDRYSDNTAFHILGYRDSSGDGVDGVEFYFDNIIKANKGTLEAIYTADALGHILISEPIEIRNTDYNCNSGIVLTIDYTIQKVVESCLKKSDITKGAVVVLDAKSGDILASASVPSVNRTTLSNHLDDENSPFLNRAFCAYPVGSVFKVVTAAAALESGVALENYYCNGSIEKNGNIFHCNNTGGHGEMALKKALAYSCNPYFIELGTRVGAEQLTQTAKELGFGEKTDLGNGYEAKSGSLPRLYELSSEAAVGNFAFGQGSLTATPLQIALCYATILNGGNFHPARLIAGEMDFGEFKEYPKRNGSRVLSESTCDTIKSGLKNALTDGTAEGAYSTLYEGYGKTATAQSGAYDDKGNELYCTWFAGGFSDGKSLYSVCILKENGISGSIDGAPLFKTIAEGIISRNP